MCLCNLGFAQCANFNYTIRTLEEVYPGEVIALPVAIVGDEFGTLSSSRIFAVLNNDDASLGSQQDSQLIIDRHCTSLLYSLHPTSNFDTQLEVTIFLKVNESIFNYQYLYYDHDIIDAISNYRKTNIISSLLLTTPVIIHLTLQHCPLFWI